MPTRTAEIRQRPSRTDVQEKGRWPRPSDRKMQAKTIPERSKMSRSTRKHKQRRWPRPSDCRRRAKTTPTRAEETRQRPSREVRWTKRRGEDAARGVGTRGAPWRPGPSTVPSETSQAETGELITLPIQLVVQKSNAITCVGRPDMKDGMKVRKQGAMARQRRKVHGSNQRQRGVEMRITCIKIDSQRTTDMKRRKDR